MKLKVSSLQYDFFVLFKFRNFYFPYFYIRNIQCYCLYRRHTLGLEIILKAEIGIFFSNTVKCKNLISRLIFYFLYIKKWRSFHLFIWLHTDTDISASILRMYNIKFSIISKKGVGMNNKTIFFTYKFIFTALLIKKSIKSGKFLKAFFILIYILILLTFAATTFTIFGSYQFEFSV